MRARSMRGGTSGRPPTSGFTIPGPHGCGARALHHDREDLVQKAVGWLLREAGKPTPYGSRGISGLKGPAFRAQPCGTRSSASTSGRVARWWWRPIAGAAHMGAEAVCNGRFRGKTVEGRARLESTTLDFRATGADALRLSIPFADITRVSARGGTLTVDSPCGQLSLDLGPAAAAKWADRIQHPRSRIQKIGVGPDSRVSALGITDEEFLHELEGTAAQLAIGRVLKASDAIFVGVEKEAELARL